MAHAPAALAIYLLGPPRIERHGQPVEVDTRKAIALLAYLALHPERLSRDQLAALLWPEYDQERAYANLRRTLWALNKAIGEGWVAADNLSLELRRQESVWIDVVEFQRLFTQWRDHGHRPDECCAACLAALAQAVKLVRGDFLEGFSLRDSAPFDDWHFFEAESLRKTVAATLEKLVREHNSQQEDETAITYARRWLALDPLHEPAHRWLMQLYAQAGQPAAAIRQYQECVRVLKAELDAPPEAETTALYHRIRSKQIGRRPAKPAPITPPVLSVQEFSPPPTPPPAPPAADQLRMVTVLCAALTEPLPAAQSYPSEQSAQRMKRIFQVAETILLRYEGRVERLLGEGVVALFGTQQQHEDDPERAVRAALELRQAAQQAGLQMSAAISSGHVYLSQQGTDTITNGPVVTLALRLQNKADSGQLLVSEAIYRQTRGVAIYTPLSLALQSQSNPLAVYQIERLHPYPQKVRGIAGLHAPLVGRSKELAALQEAIATPQQGEGQLITLIGEAGLGKSRLVSELKQHFGFWILDFRLPESSSVADVQSKIQNLKSKILWLEGRCLEMSLSTSYWPFLDILRAYLGWQPEESEANRAGRIVTALDRLMTHSGLTAEQRDEMGPLLGNLLAVRFGNDWDDRLKFAGPEQIRHQTLIMLRDFFVALAHQQPVMLVLEDLHWADSLSLDLIALLMETLAAHPLCLLCVYRPERQHRCWQLATLAAAKCPDHFSEVRLRELTTRQSQQLVEALLTIENLPPKVKATLLQKAQGNPLFVEEVIRSLIDAGIVYRQDEVWRAKEEIENVVVPETVQSVILSRVDRLGDALKGLLQRAAVIGRIFGRRLLAQLAPPGLDLDNAISALTNHALIYQERVTPEEEYSFKHVLVQEAIYQNMLDERRQQFHRQAGEALEQLYADNLMERYEQLAYHYDRSEVAEKAVEYLLKAGEKARRAYLNDEAIRYFQRILERFDESSPDQPRVLSQTHQLWRLETLKQLAEALLYAGKLEDAEILLRQALVLGREIGAPSRQLAPIYFWLGEVFWWQSRYQDRIKIGEEGLALLAVHPQSVEVAAINSIIGWGYYGIGDFTKAREFTFHNATFITSLPYTDELRSPYEHIALAYMWFEKNGEEAMKWAQELQVRAEHHHDLRAVASASVAMAYIAHSCGDLHSTMSHLQRSFQLWIKVGDPKEQMTTAVLLGFRAFQLGDLDRAAEYIAKANGLIQSAKLTSWAPYGHEWRGRLAFCRGARAEAIENFQQAYQIDHELGNPVFAVGYLYYLALIYLAQGDSVQALGIMNQVVEHWAFPEMEQHLRREAEDFVKLLSTLEAAYADAAVFRSHCQRIRTNYPALASLIFNQWFLEPTLSNFSAMQAGTSPAAFVDYEFDGNKFQNLIAKIQNREWIWHDQFADCTYKLNNGLEIYAGNGRDLWASNLSAPRLLRPITERFTIQAVCTLVSPTYPAIGGILLWQDKQNYLRLDKGLLGVHEISFRGCLANKDIIIGRGRLPAERVFLRLERSDARVNALCSANGEEWFTVGHVDFLVADPVQVGMHAIGQIDRLIYPGAYPDGTAIRFESFTVYKPTEEIELTSAAEPRIV